MRRRQFLIAGLSLAGTLIVRPVRGQPSATRGAVVIGVDKAGSMPKLNAAASGAIKIGDWLRSEGFEVKQFVDTGGPVRASDLFDAIKGFIDRGTLEQLVIYFAGHGFVSGSLSEFWLLSGAPENPNEAVSLTESRAFAKQSGIPNVVFISDACRSPAQSVRLASIHGQVVFSRGPPNVDIDVDTFLATRIGAEAFEVAEPGAEVYEGIYTTCFLEAFRRPYSEMVHPLNGSNVIPNRRLKRYLATEVPKLAQAKSIRLVQKPDSEVNSDEPTFIGHVVGDQRLELGGATPTVADVAQSELQPYGAVVPGHSFSTAALSAVANRTGFDRISRGDREGTRRAGGDRLAVRLSGFPSEHRFRGNEPRGHRQVRERPPRLDRSSTSAPHRQPALRCASRMGREPYLRLSTD